MPLNNKKGNSGDAAIATTFNTQFLIKYEYTTHIFADCEQKVLMG